MNNTLRNRTVAAWGSLCTSLLVTLLAGCTRPAPPAPPVPSVFVTQIRNDAGLDSRMVSGSIRPRFETELAFRMGGKVLMRQVELGQAVRAGQALARLDPADAQLAVDAAADQVRASQADATQAASDAARFQRLLADGSVAAADHERQQARADAAAARTAQAQRQWDLQRNRLGYAVLSAPFDGVITGLRVEVGQSVAEGQVVLTLARPEELDVLADVPDAWVATLRSYTATAQLAGHAAPVPLKLREVAPVAAAQTRTFRARYALPRSAVGVSMGATAELHLHRPGTQPSAELPLPALLQTGGVPSVWLADERTGGLTRRPVQVLAQTTDQVRVVGLPDGAWVVSVGAQKLDAGLKVQLVRRPLDALAHARAGSQP